jgi:hypothetical protein
MRGVEDYLEEIKRLEEDGERTIVRYTADAIVDGIIAEVGQRMVAGVVQRTAGQFFAAIERDLAAIEFVERLSRPLLASTPGRYSTPQGRRDLDSAELGRVQHSVGRLDRRSDRLVSRRAQKVLHQRGCVSNDESQDAFLRWRSSRIRSAAGIPRSTDDLRAIRLNTSSAGGRSISRSRIS